MEQFQHSVAQQDDRNLRIFGFGEAPVAAKLGYAIREVVVGTEHEIKTQFSGDLIAVKGPSIFGRDGANEWAIMAPEGKNAEASTAERLDYFIADQAATPHIGVFMDGEEDAIVVATWELPKGEDDRDLLELLVIGAVEAANQAPAASLADQLARGATHCATRQTGAMTPIQQMVHDGLIAAAAKSGRKLVSASELPPQKGNIGVDSCTTLATLKVDGTDFDLRVCGTGAEAYFEWINDGGDPIGDVFDELGDVEAEKQRFRSIVERKAAEDHESRFLKRLYSMYDDPDSNVKSGASGFEILDAMAGAIRHQLDQQRKKDEGLTRVEKGFALAGRRFAFENLELLSFYSTQAEAEQTMNASSDARDLCVVPATVRFASNGNVRLWQVLGEPVAKRKLADDILSSATHDMERMKAAGVTQSEFAALLAGELNCAGEPRKLDYGKRMDPSTSDCAFTEVNVFDGSIGRDGQYCWKQLPQPMTKREADDYAHAHGWCPIERYR